MLFQLTPAAMPEGYGEALVPLVDAKEWCRVLDSDEDLLIEALRDAAINAVEQCANLFMGPRSELIATFAGFGPRMRIGRGPAAMLEVTAVSYLDADGATVVLEAGAWRVDVGGGLIPAIGACWPTTYGPVTVEYSAGFAEGECPRGLITAAKLFVAHLFANREAVVMSGAAGELPLGFRMLCDQHRMPVI